MTWRILVEPFAWLLTNWSRPALTRLNASKFEAVIVTKDENMKKGSKIQCIDISMILAGCSILQESVKVGLH
ncbi:hypothetical protein CRE_14943 [Caenorhabditis remanei]|uniref:Uncharacterized protein n=1 Tax=Caenorhabditis remanei TaxID=31234 RepID=E3NBY7_CAERE|nr:hypothetical protein CRE_14943 [Caenorhabditis remanei]